MSASIVPKIHPITPTNLYLQVVGSHFEYLRKTRDGFSYIPPQFGGIFGQQKILRDSIPMELTQFSVN